MNEISKEDLEELKRVARSCGPKIEQSKIFLALVSKSYLEDPTAALQLGIAILLGKPIAVIGIDGVEIPDTLRKAAFHVAEHKNVKDAAASVVEALKRYEEEKNGSQLRR